MGNVAVAEKLAGSDELYKLNASEPEPEPEPEDDEEDDDDEGVGPEGMPQG